MERKKWRFSLALGLILAIAAGSFTPFYAACAQVRENTLRLHILANSDSREDQALKLAVRDAILEEQGSVFGTAHSKEEAVALADGRLARIEAIARDVVRANGRDDPVQVRLENLYFTTRVYEDFTLPAGRYDAVRVEIGRHEGKNWFCVLFPPLCVPAAAAQDDAQDDAGYTDEQTAAVKSPYKVKFAAVELLERVREAL